MQIATRSTSRGILTSKERSKKIYPLISNAEKLVTMDKEKAEVLNSFFLSQPSVATFLPTPLESVDCKVGTGDAKCF